MQINQDFKKLIPPLTSSEYSQLEENCISEGIRDAIIVWNGYIIDGHNRYKIATENNLPYKTENKDFTNESDVKIWMINNQFGRRNLSNYQRSVLALELESVFSEKAKENLKLAAEKTNTPLQISANPIEIQPINTRLEVAKVANVSHDTIAKVKKIQAVATPEIKEQLISGTVSINEAYTAIKKTERAAEIKEQRKELAEQGKNVEGDKYRIFHGDITTWQSDKQYDWIITDPPYPKEFLNLWETLALRSNELLKDGGLLVAMSGQMYLDEIYNMLSKHLKYYWTACYLTMGQPTPLRHVNVNTTWKPLLIFGKGTYKGKIFGDVYKSDGNDKEHHKWGQSVSGMDSIIRGLCLEGQSILDPFCCAGTTGISAVKHGCLFDGLEIEIENVNISKARIYDTTKSIEM